MDAFERALAYVSQCLPDGSSCLLLAVCGSLSLAPGGCREASGLGSRDARRMATGCGVSTHRNTCSLENAGRVLYDCR